MTAPLDTAGMWEIFRDEAYFGMWCVREIGERRFGAAFHVSSEVEAEELRAALTAKDSEMAEARAALEVCQRAIAMMISPDAIGQTSVANAFAAATEAEARARTVLSREKEAG